MASDIELSIGFDQAAVDKEIEKVNSKIKKMTTAQKESNKILDKLETQYQSLNTQLEIESALHGKNSKYVKQMEMDINAVNSELSKEYMVQDEINRKLEVAKNLRKELYLAPAPTIRALQQESLDSKILADETKKAQKQTQAMNSELSKTEPKIKKAANSTKNLSSNLKGASVNASAIQKGFDKSLKPLKSMMTRINGLIKRILIFSVIARSLNVFREYVGAAVNSNYELANALAVVRVNLQTAFISIFSAILPALQSFVDWLGRATAYIAAFISSLLGTTYKASLKVARSINSQAGATKNLGKQTKKANKEIDKQLAAFDELNILSKEIADETDDIGGVDVPTSGGDVSPTMPDYSEQILNAEKFAQRIREIFAGANSYFKPIYDAFDRLREKLAPFAEPLAKGLEYTFNNVLRPMADWAVQSFIPQYIDTIASAWALIAQTLVTLEPIWEDFNERILKPFAKVIGQNVIDRLEDIQYAFDEMTEGIKENEPEIQALFRDLNDLLEMSWKSVIKPVLDKISKLFRETFRGIVDSSKKNMGPLIEVLRGVTIFLKGIFTNDWKTIWEGIKKIMTGSVDLILNALSTLTGINFNDLKKAFRSLVDFIDALFRGDWSRAWQAAKTVMIGVANSIVSAFESMVNFVIRGMNKLSGGLNGIIGNINKIPGVNIPNIPSANEISIPRIPYLAKGAVIPANKQFLAVLGDQKSGTNVEAPLATIKQALIEALAESNMQGQGEYTFVAQIDGSTIFKETVKQNNMYRKRMGKNAFSI